MTSFMRSASQLARDRKRIAEMYLQGYLQSDIAQELGLCVATVSRDLKVIRERWELSALRDFDAMRARELAKLDNLEIEYWEAWQRSIGLAKTVTEKGLPGEDGGLVVKERTEKSEPLLGDPRFLRGVYDCIQARCAILGVKAPRQVDVTSKGESISGALTKDQRMSLLQALAEGTEDGEGVEDPS